MSTISVPRKNVTISVVAPANAIEITNVGKAGADGVGVPTGGTTGQILAKNSATNYDTEWIDDTGGMTSFTAAADSGSSQTISDSNTLTIAGGTGIDTVASATDTVTVSVDSTIATNSMAIALAVAL